ncbi:MAG: DUF5596 domain-containing protein [Lentisphaeria bacterium]|nr:DUF5596 domain-containing protein [Lentisphaeria bacterium]
MTISVEEFSRRCRLTAEEADSLREILADEKIMQAAEFIAQCCFYPENREEPPKLPESIDASKAWYAACYLGAEAAERHYAKRGYPQQLLFDSMTDLGIWLRNSKRNFGVIGLGYARSWEADIWHGSVIRFGRLMCNSTHFYSHETLRDENGKILLQKGDAVINMHIPEDGPMDIGECKKSMERMREFFAEYRKGYDWKGFLCESWLLDSQLRQMLPANSNIIRFQDMGYRYDMGEYDETVFRIFGTTPPDEIKNPTTLQRKAAEFLKSGGKFREEGMFIPR